MSDGTAKRRTGRRKPHDVHKRMIKLVVVIECVEHTGVINARMHDLASGRSFACEERFDDDAECMVAGDRLITAAMQKARSLLRLPGNPYDLGLNRAAEGDGKGSDQ